MNKNGNFHVEVAVFAFYTEGVSPFPNFPYFCGLFKTFEMKYFIIILLLISTNLLGQVKLKDLQGYWVCPNQDSAYFKKDTLVLVQFQNSNFKEENKFLYEHCEFYDWEIKKKELRIHEKQFCKEPTTQKAGINYFLNNIEIIESRNLIFLILNKYGFRETEVFLVLSLNISKLDNYKTLKLKRIDFIKDK